MRLCATLLEKEGGLKNVDINLKCSWIKQLYNDRFHKWKLIPLQLIQSTCGTNFKFHSNLDFDESKNLTCPSLLKQVFHFPFPILSQPT